MRTKKFAVATAVLAGIGLVTAPGAVADDTSDPVVIGDRTFGAEDGLVIESGTVTLSPTRAGTVTPMAVTKYSRGSSYSQTDHPTIISYVGKSRAMANIYGGQRVIRASFKYVRGDSDVISWQHSSASLGSGCSWAAGAEKSRTVYDSLLPNAPVTRFRYDFAYINPQVC